MSEPQESGSEHVELTFWYVLADAIAHNWRNEGIVGKALVAALVLGPVAICVLVGCLLTLFVGVLLP